MCADGWDKRWVAVALFVLQGVATLLLIHIESRVATYLLTLTFGFTIGNIYMMQSLLVGEYFGMVSFGAIFGFVSMASQVSSGAGPLLVGWLEDISGSYELPFTVTAALTLAAAVVIVLVRAPRGLTVEAPSSESSNGERGAALSPPGPSSDPAG